MAYDLTILILGIIRTCKRVFIASFFEVAPKWKLLKYAQKTEWENG
jgi:hypothetical protein